MKTLKDCREQAHWEMENFKQRITRKEWKAILLNGDDTLIFQGNIRQLKAKNLGVGVIEISKAPIS